MIPFFKKIRAAQRPRCAALVAAAGSSSRMGCINKLLEPLDGIPVLVRTLTALERAQRVDSIVIATREEDLITVSQLCKTYGITKCKKVIRGGEDREHSVLLAALEADPDTELLAVQDGARHLVSPALIDRVRRHWSAAACGRYRPPRSSRHLCLRLRCRQRWKRGLSSRTTVLPWSGLGRWST